MAQRHRGGEFEERVSGDGGSTTLRHKRVLARVIRFARAIRLSSHGGGYRAVMKHVILSSRTQDNCAYRTARATATTTVTAPLRENNVIRHCTIARGRIIEKVRFPLRPFRRPSLFAWQFQTVVVRSLIYENAIIAPREICARMERGSCVQAVSISGARREENEN